MLTPDRVIVRKIKEYDRNLFVKWNNRQGYFELWIKTDKKGELLVTPVTESIYDNTRPKVFTPLDERLLWWIYEADSHRNGGARKHSLIFDSRWKEWIKKIDRDKRQKFRDLGKDIWQGANNFFTTKSKPKNGKPKFENYKQSSKWIAPDSQMRTSPRLFNRSKLNAIKYGYKR